MIVMPEYLVIAVLLVLLTILYTMYRKQRKEYLKLQMEFSTRVTEEAKRMFDKWVTEEKAKIESQLRDLLEQEYKLKLQKWIEEKESAIREDAIKRSVSSILGKIGEHIAPLILAQKIGADPRDFRFIGTPIDYIVFKGLSVGSIEEIVFLEVKTGRSSRLTDREKAVKKAVEEKKVRWITANLYDEVAKARALLEVEAKKLSAEHVQQTTESTRGFYTQSQQDR